MSFAVYGVAWKYLYERALKNVERVDGRGKALSQSEVFERAKTVADEQYESGSTRAHQVSGAFDAPQYAEDFIRHANETDAKIRSMRILVDVPTGEVSEKTGAAQEALGKRQG